MPIFWIVVFFIVPMAVVWLYSFGQNTGPADIAISGTLENYKRATEWLYVSIFLKSLAVSALVTLICLVVGFPVAMAITFAPTNWRPWLLLGIMLPFWTNLLIRTYALMTLMGNNGYANRALGALWDGASWLRTLVGMQPLDAWTPAQLLYNNFAVIFGLVYVHLPFMVLPLYSVMRVISPSYARAARSLGATSWTTFRRIYLPQTLPGIGAGVLLVFILAVGYYITPALVGGAEGQLFSNQIQFHMSKSNWSQASALAAMLLVGVLLLYWLYDRLVGIDKLKLG